MISMKSTDPSRSIHGVSNSINYFGKESFINFALLKQKSNSELGVVVYQKPTEARTSKKVPRLGPAWAT